MHGLTRGLRRVGYLCAECSFPSIIVINVINVQIRRELEAILDNNDRKRRLGPSRSWPAF